MGKGPEEQERPSPSTRSKSCQAQTSPCASAVEDSASPTTRTAAAGTQVEWGAPGATAQAKPAMTIAAAAEVPPVCSGMAFTTSLPEEAGAPVAEMAAAQPITTAGLRPASTGATAETETQLRVRGGREAARPSSLPLVLAEVDRKATALAPIHPQAVAEVAVVTTAVALGG